MPIRISIQIQSHTISAPSRSKRVIDLGEFFQRGKKWRKRNEACQTQIDHVMCGIIYGAWRHPKLKREISENFFEPFGQPIGFDAVFPVSRIEHDTVDILVVCILLCVWWECEYRCPRASSPFFHFNLHHSVGFKKY